MSFKDDDYVNIVLHDNNDKGNIIKPNSILVMGFPSIGQIGQIGIDSFIAMHRFHQRIGHIDTNLVYPLSGYESYSQNVKSDNWFLCQAIEIYELDSTAQNSIYALIFRSSCLPGKAKSFAHSLLKEIERLGFHDIIILTGASTEGIEPSENRFFTYQSNCQESNAFKNYSLLLHYLSVTQELIPISRNDPFNVEYEYGNQCPPFGMLMTKEFIVEFNQLKDQNANNKIKSSSLLVLGRYVNLGENTIAALELSSISCYILNVTSTQVLPAEMNVPMSLRLIMNDYFNEQEQYIY